MFERFVSIFLGLSAISSCFGGSFESKTVEENKTWWEWDYATGDWFGGRTTFSEKGVDVFGSYTAEIWGNTTGGLKQGSVYTGLLNFGTDVDLKKLVGWEGATVNTTWLWLSGRDASEDLVGNFLTVSNIAGFNTLRMMELWFQQELLENRVSVRIGQLTADSEFVISDYGSLFLNGTFGWPAPLYTNLPEGGPGYPMGTLAVRLAVNPVEWFTFQTALFQGNVFAQDVNRHGFRWDLNSDQGYFWINEIQTRWNQSEDTFALPGQAKWGAWFHSGDFSDPFVDTAGTSLANAASSGIPQPHAWNCGFYGIVDQMLYREQGERFAGSSKDGGPSKERKPLENPSRQGLGWFGRIFFEPQDRNFVGFYFDSGLSYTGLIPNRDEDLFGLAFGYAQLTTGARNLLEEGGSTGTGAEMVLECSYQAVISPWMTIQPDLQYIINPGGTQDLNNAFVIGGRASITF